MVSSPRRVLSLLFVFCVASASAQVQLTTGDIAGTVTDPSGSSIEKASVTATDPDRGLSRSAVTDADGEFRIQLLPPGRYTLRVEAAGFATTTVHNVEVRLGVTARVPVAMVLPQVSSEVTVDAQ